MRARNQLWKKHLAHCVKKSFNRLNCPSLSVVNRGRGDRRFPSKERRYSPYSSPSITELLLLLHRILMQPVRRIGNHRMNGSICLTRDPVKAITVH